MHQRVLPTDAGTEPLDAPEWGARWLRLELRRLRTLLSLHLLRHEPQPVEDPLRQFRGLVITGAEVSSLFREEQVDSEQVQGLLAELVEIDRSVAEAEGVAPSPLARLTDRLGLTALERGCVALCLAPEADARFAKLYAYAQDDVTRKLPTVGLALALLCGDEEERLAARAVFRADAPLVRYRVVHIAPDTGGERTPLILRPLKLDDGVVEFLLGSAALDARVTPFTRVVRGVSGDAEDEFGARLRAALGREESRGRAYALRRAAAGGDDRDWLPAAIGTALDGPVLVVDAGKLPRVDGELAGALRVVFREALLRDAGVCVRGLTAAQPAEEREALRSALASLSGEFGIASVVDWPADVPLGLHDGVTRIDLPVPETPPGAAWAAGLRDCGCAIAPEVDAAELAAKFRLDPGRVRLAVTGAADAARWRSPEAPVVTADDLHAACRRASAAVTGGLVHRIEPAHGWDELVLPDDAVEQLREICQRVRCRDRVLGEWGFGRKLSRGKGLVALFAGPSGTGKTMAAEVLAGALGLDLYRVDLSGVVSKYIGETEKNFNAVFASVRHTNSIVFIDECDAVLGKRSEVHDAHDRYANIEIAYLLQKLEEFDGVAILATNLRQNLDESFLRRLTFTVHFPFPDEAARRRIWETVWPAGVPLAPEMEFTTLAREIKVSGGNIKNIALAATYLAAAADESVGGSHVLRAVRREFQKFGKTVSEMDTRVFESRSAEQFA